MARIEPIRVALTGALATDRFFDLWWARQDSLAAAARAI
jgi:hypothetical protein